jgi:hypothetical protein
MAEETPPVDEMHYEQLAQDALRGVIRSALERAALPDGIPGAHHFYVTFKTRAPGVSVPPDILAKYPDEMTVVLQHQYWDLKVEPTKFSVMLKFGGMPKVLAMPTAVTRFDPRCSSCCSSGAGDGRGNRAEVGLRTRRPAAESARRRS